MTIRPDRPDAPPPSPAALPTWFLTVVTIPIVIGILYFGQKFLIPVTMATLLLVLNLAIIDRLDKATLGGRSVPRWLAYLVATAAMFLGLVGFGYVASGQALAFQDALPRYAARLEGLKADISALVGADIVAAVESAVRTVDIQSVISGLATAAADMLGSVGLILLYLAFMLAERGKFAEKLPRLCSTPDEAARVAGMLASISVGVRQYMWINTLTSAMSGALAFVVLRLLGVDFAATLAMMVFLLNFIPSIGSFLAVLFPTLVALLQFESIAPAVIVVVAYGGGDAVIGNVVQPRLQGKTLNISTFVVILALTFWGLLWGGIGAFIAVPLTVVVMIVCSHVPGLRPFARLLSSDGFLPGENDNAAPGAARPDREAEADGLPGKPVSQSRGSRM